MAYARWLATAQSRRAMDMNLRERLMITRPIDIVAGRLLCAQLVEQGLGLLVIRHTEALAKRTVDRG
jgi:hypothetical protein